MNPERVVMSKKGRRKAPPARKEHTWQSVLLLHFDEIVHEIITSALFEGAGAAYSRGVILWLVL